MIPNHEDQLNANKHCGDPNRRIELRSMRINRSGIFRLFLAFAFTHLTVYQTIDRYGDTYKAVFSQIHRFQEGKSKIAAIENTEEDFDAWMPLMLGRVVVPDSFSFVPRSQPHFDLFTAVDVLKTESHAVHPHGRSPPYDFTSNPHLSCLLSRTCLHILAPPQA